MPSPFVKAFASIRSVARAAAPGRRGPLTRAPARLAAGLVGGLEERPGLHDAPGRERFVAADQLERLLRRARALVAPASPRHPHGRAGIGRDRDEEGEGDEGRRRCSRFHETSDERQNGLDRDQRVLGTRSPLPSPDQQVRGTPSAAESGGTDEPGCRSGERCSWCPLGSPENRSSSRPRMARRDSGSSGISSGVVIGSEEPWHSLMAERHEYRRNLAKFRRRNSCGRTSPWSRASR